MNIFKRRKNGDGFGNVNPKRLGIFEEVYGPGTTGTKTSADSAGNADQDEVLLLDRPVDENGQPRGLDEGVEKPIYLSKPRARDEVEKPCETVADEGEMPTPDPRVILMANVKGGCGKSTTAMHLALYLLDRGYSVGTIDLDGGQGTLTRMLENRRNYAETLGIDLPMPEHRDVQPSTATDGEIRNSEERAAFTEALDALDGMDFIIVDTPGSAGFLTRLAHRAAGRLITPVNDSFVDLDVFARIEDGADRPEPGVYARMVMDERDRRAAEGEAPLDWIVVRNRLSHLYARNKAEVAETLENLSAHFDFRLAAGFGERVVFREFFAKGLTLLDLRRREIGVDWSLSHVAAREELRQLLEAIGLSEVANDRKADGEPAEGDVVQSEATAELEPQIAMEDASAEQAGQAEVVAA